MLELRLISILACLVLLNACNLQASTTIRATAAVTATRIDESSAPETNTVPTQAAIAATAIPTEASCTPITGWQSYVIQRGDTLSSIATKTNSTVDELIAANCIENPNRIIVGTSLFVPRLPTADLPPTSTGGEDSSSLTTFTEPGLLAFDYPSNWKREDFTGGLGGSMVGTITLSEQPPAAMPWSDDLVVVSFSPYPEEFVPGSTETWITVARDDWASGERNTILVEPAPITLPSGITGHTMTIFTANHDEKQYYLEINGQFVLLVVAGNIEVGERVIATLRPA